MKIPASEVAAIPMEKILADVHFLFPEQPDPDGLRQMKGEEPFSEQAITWLSALSHVLSKDPGTKQLPDVATFAFFCRKANLLQLKKQYCPENSLRSGRGLVFHITPKNVPCTFAYSLASGILSGNANVVKIPSGKSAQSDAICRAICELGRQKEFRHVSSRQALVRYDQTSSATGYFSSICDVRVIWGGDSSIDEIRKNRLSTRAFDINFASRY